MAARKSSAGSRRKSAGPRKKTSGRKKAAGSTRKSAAKSTRKTPRKATRKTARKTTRKTGRKTTSKRELLEPTAGDKRYVRRTGSGRFKDQVDVGRSLSQDVRKKAKRSAPSGQGDRGD